MKSDPYNPYQNNMLRHILLLRREWLLDFNTYDDLKKQGFLKDLNTNSSIILALFKRITNQTKPN